MRRGTLARLEINLSVALVAVLLVLAGYGLVSTLADRLDPRVRDCVAKNPTLSHRDAAALCKHLEEIGALP